MASREFDLNIERVLEDWTVAHAVRELIANALDEAAFTSSREPEICRDDTGRWHIRDFGRGLRYEHLAQNENREKLADPEKVVGKFGVGLKDALATFDRHGIAVRIRSRFGDISTARQHKHGFDDITTLHAVIEDPSDADMVGTDVGLDGVADDDVEAARACSGTTPATRCSRRPSTASSFAVSRGWRGSTSTGCASPRSRTICSATTSPRRRRRSARH